MIVKLENDVFRIKVCEVCKDFFISINKWDEKCCDPSDKCESGCYVRKLERLIYAGPVQSYRCGEPGGLGVPCLHPDRGHWPVWASHTSPSSWQLQTNTHWLPATPYWQPETTQQWVLISDTNSIMSLRQFVLLLKCIAGTLLFKPWSYIFIIRPLALFDIHLQSSILSSGGAQGHSIWHNRGLHHCY